MSITLFALVGFVAAALACTYLVAAQRIRATAYALYGAAAGWALLATIHIEFIQPVSYYAGPVENGTVHAILAGIPAAVVIFLGLFNQAAAVQTVSRSLMSSFDDARASVLLGSVEECATVASLEESTGLSSYWDFRVVAGYPYHAWKNGRIRTLSSGVFAAAAVGVLVAGVAAETRFPSQLVAALIGLGGVTVWSAQRRIRLAGVVRADGQDVLIQVLDGFDPEFVVLEAPKVVSAPVLHSSADGCWMIMQHPRRSHWLLVLGVPPQEQPSPIASKWAWFSMLSFGQLPPLFRS